MKLAGYRFFAMIFVAWVVLIFSQASQAIVMLNVDSNGFLTGATGVEVNGSLYDVQFMDGSCNSLFNNCDSANFAFNTYTDATAASQSLLSQVFVDTNIGNFDSNPTLTDGCTYLPSCYIETPYALYLSDPSFTYVAAINYGGSTADATYGYGQLDADTTFNGDIFGASHTFAIWSKDTTPQPSSVPEPASVALLGMGLIGLGVSGHHRKRKAQG